MTEAKKPAAKKPAAKAAPADPAVAEALVALRAEGFDDETIRPGLIARGFAEKDVDAAIKTVAK